ncbi:MAG: hypothetical protein KJ990_04640 [Proteobacteria bacterium]|nr:hypothetical protein [Pseudomonadota bacterium]MBU1649987.1 hypothetical protein [Pseudomonadota bacterium]
MVPLKIFEDGSIHEFNNDNFCHGIIELCEKHIDENRALAFAFLIYDFCNPQIFKVLEDIHYWNALNAISGKLLSIYYIHSREKYFAEDLSAASEIERRSMYPISTGNNSSHLHPILKNYLSLDYNVKLPSILFFQVEGGLISDYFIVELDEESIEKSFIEVKSYIEAAVERLKMIAPEYYGNSQPIFESLKQGIGSIRFRKVLFRNIQKFPVKLLLGWLLGKV